VTPVLIKTAIICLADHVLPRLPVVLHHGPAGSLVVAGTDAWTRHLPDRFFGSEPRTSQELGRWPVWRIHGLLQSWRSRVDLVAARVDRFSAVRFPPERFLCVPEWVRMVASVKTENTFFASSQARRNERLVKKNGLSWRVSHDPRDLTLFIERDYRPYTRARYGEDAYLRSNGWFFSRYRDGGLVWIESDSEPVAAMLFDVYGRSLRRLAVACVRGDDSLLRTGGMSATYLACFDLARRLGCDEIDFRNCRPYVNDGLLQVKRSWGGRLVEPDDLTHDLLIGWERTTPSVVRFFTESPLVIRKGSGFEAIQGDASLTHADRYPSGVGPRIAPVPGGAFGEWIPVRDGIP
jgi:hypothetical protein